MREIDKIANEKFGGSVEKTIEYLLCNSDGYDIKGYVNEMTPEEARYTLKFIEDRAVSNAGGRKNFNKALKMEFNLQYLKLTEEEVKNAKFNPFKIPLLKSLLIMLLSVVIVVCVSLFGKQLGMDSSVVSAITSLAIGLSTVSLSDKVIKYFKFKSVKKTIEKLKL